MIFAKTIQNIICWPCFQDELDKICHFQPFSILYITFLKSYFKSQTDFETKSLFADICCGFYAKLYFALRRLYSAVFTYFTFMFKYSYSIYPNLINVYQVLFVLIVVKI